MFTKLKQTGTNLYFQRGYHTVHVSAFTLLVKEVCSWCLQFLGKKSLVANGMSGIYSPIWACEKSYLDIFLSSDSDKTNHDKRLSIKVNKRTLITKTAIFEVSQQNQFSKISNHFIIACIVCPTLSKQGLTVTWKMRFWLRARWLGR